MTELDVVMVTSTLRFKGVVGRHLGPDKGSGTFGNLQTK